MADHQAQVASDPLQSKHHSNPTAGLGDRFILLHDYYKVMVLADTGYPVMCRC